MNNKERYKNMRFDRQTNRLPGKLTAIAVVLITYLILWRLLPTGGMLVITLIVLAVLTWIASLNWRQALAHIIQFLEDLQGL